MLKKTIITLSLLVWFCFPISASAKNNGNGGFQGNYGAVSQSGGFTGPMAGTATVSDALKLGDDTWVVLVGKIERQIGHGEYLFSDGTGTITVDIDDEDWLGVSISPYDLVEIQGEVDKDFTSLEIEVRKIVKK